MGEGPMDSYDQIMKCDTEKYSMFFKEMLQRGILLPPAQFESWFLSDSHSFDELDYTLKSVKEALKVAFKI
jgi:glutamate-1-semialdehyde 2,1-aminomutase